VREVDRQPVLPAQKSVRAVKAAGAKLRRGVRARNVSWKSLGGSEGGTAGVESGNIWVPFLIRLFAFATNQFHCDMYICIVTLRTYRVDFMIFTLGVLSDFMFASFRLPHLPSIYIVFRDPLHCFHNVFDCNSRVI